MPCSSAHATAASGVANIRSPCVCSHSPTSSTSSPSTTCFLVVCVQTNGTSSPILIVCVVVVNTPCSGSGSLPSTCTQSPSCTPFTNFNLHLFRPESPLY